MITNQIYNEDCLEALKRVPDNSVDCIITDPPYFLGMTHNGQKGSFKDLSICKPFYRDLFQEFNRVKKPGACVYFFTDWRGYAFYYPLFDLYLGASNMLVWNKQSGPGNHYAFIHELILFHCGKGVSIGATNIIDNIRSFASGAKLVEGEKVHPTQKPVALIRKLIEDSTKPGDLILDTFGGSGTTAVASIESGRNFVLMEQDEIYYFTAQKRIKDSDWMARQVYADSLNFFYTQDNVRPQAFANLYAEKAENWANTVFLMGNVKEAKNLLKLAAELRGCYKDQQTEIPEELLSQKSTVIYTTSRKDLGVPEIDRKELEEFIDAIPEIPVIVRDNIKEDARIKAFDLKKRMLYDIKEFGEDNEGE